MKLILTGATGLIGGEILIQCLADPRITSLVCLTRRDLPSSVTSNPKLRVIKLEDFTSYTPEVLKEVGGCEGCIWALGSPAMRNSNMQECRKIEIDYPVAAAQAFISHLAPALKEKGKAFHFLYVSGMGAVRDVEKGKKLWFLPETRRIKGEVESKLLDLQKGNNFEVTIVRPGGVLPKGSIMPDVLVGLTRSIRLDELAAVIVDEVLWTSDEEGKGSSVGRTLENGVARERGREILKGRK